MRSDKIWYEKGGGGGGGGGGGYMRLIIACATLYTEDLHPRIDKWQVTYYMREANNQRIWMERWKKVRIPQGESKQCKHQ